MENYLRAIHEIERREGKVTTSALAQRLEVAAASVTGMVKKLAESGLVDHQPYQGVVLTEAGRQRALEVVRHHRLLETYLHEALGVPWDQVHAEADRWEHVLSEEMEDRIDALLGHPTHDPHGSPIPGRDGTLAPLPAKRLSHLAPGQMATVARVSTPSEEMLRYLGNRGLRPGVSVEVLAVEPFNGPLTIRVGEAEHLLSREVALCVAVVDPGPPAEGV